jgi:dUTPase
MSQPIATLILYVPGTNAPLVDLYKVHIEKHNESIHSNYYPNSGFDIFVPNETIFNTPFETQYINMQVKAQMTFNNAPSAYIMHPRSSISKTPLMLANSAGIIDCGYRGNLIGAFRTFSAPYGVEKHTRLLQICHPTLCPIHVKLTHDENDLSDTLRGSGGFGSTGIVGVSVSPI